MSTNNTTLIEATRQYFEELDYSTFQKYYSNLEKARSFLRNEANFRPFHEGITDLLREIPFDGNLDDNDAKTEFLMTRLRAVGSTLEKKTVKDWVSGKRRPRIENSSRERMYELCFALNLTKEQVEWFFGHIYFGRCFNYRIIEEAVYCFCFAHQLPYATAKEMIETVKSAPAPNHTETSELFTQSIKNMVENVSSKEELVEKLIFHRNSFSVWNQSTASNIRAFREELLGNANDETVSNALTSLRTDWATLAKQSYFAPCSYESYKERIDKCGLLVQYLCAREHFERPDNNFARAMNEYFSGDDPFSDSFLLRTILTTDTGVARNSELPEVIKTNFPSKKIFSDLFNEIKIGTSTSYDSIRKVLILLKFYAYWCPLFLGAEDKSSYHTKEAFKKWTWETDALLTNCGYQKLCVVNPYDLVFLIAGSTPTPLAFFSELMGELIDEE